MVSFPVELLKELTDEDVLSIDPVKEYDRRKIWRDWAQKRLEQLGDGPDELLELGRPTGP